MVDRRDLLESELQELIHDVFIYGKYSPIGYTSLDGYAERLHELLVSYFDSEASDVGAQDEASEARAVGDGVRPEPHLRGLEFKPTVFDEITSEFTKQMSLRFYPEGIKPIGHCKLEKMPDGSIHARIKFHPQNPR